MSYPVGEGISALRLFPSYSKRPELLLLFRYLKYKLFPNTIGCPKYPLLEASYPVGEAIAVRLFPSYLTRTNFPSLPLYRKYKLFPKIIGDPRYPLLAASYPAGEGIAVRVFPSYLKSS